ncbi:MAG: response regulator [bacterium]|nr:response regulator [bacterium]
MGRNVDAMAGRFLLWRVPMMLAAALVVVLQAHSFLWGLSLLLPLGAGMLFVHLFDPAVLRRWTATGYLLAADLALVCLVLLGLGRLKPAVFLAFLGVAFVSTLAADRVRGLIGAGAWLGLLGSLSASGVLPAWVMTPEFLAYVPLCVASSLSFSTIAARMTSRESVEVTAPAENGELWTLLEITEALGKTLDVGQVMRSIVQRVGELMSTESCSILLFDESVGSCFVVASKGHPEVDMLEVDLSRYPEVRAAMETREPVVVDDVQRHPLVDEVREVLIAKGYRSLLVVPLIFGSDVLGALFLRTRNEKPFTRDELRFCKVVAGASANALKNALLFREAESAAERHRATGEKLRRVLNGSPDLIVATDAAGRIKEFNRGAEALTGVSADRAVGRPLAVVVGNDASVWDRDDDAESSDPRDVKIQRSDGERVEISMIDAPLSDAAGAPAGRVWIGRDVTKLRRVEQSLIQAERLSSLGEVVAGVAHELNNPLSGVVGYAELLRAQARDQSQVRDLERIVESAMRCQKIVFKLLSFARRHPSEKRNHDLNACVTKVLDLKSYHLRSSQIETVLELDADLPRTRFDFHQIEQVVLNLLNNAEQAIASIKTPGRIVLRSGRLDDRLFVEVEDNGPGVPPQIKNRVFDPFFTTKALGQGTGLGLSVSYGIVSEHGGELQLLPREEGNGAKFRLVLPLSAAADEPSSPPTPLELEVDDALDGRRILVAEDEPVVLELLGRVLMDLGAKVEMARDGNEAWDHIEREEFDLIVADMRMPNLDGRQLYEKVAEHRPEMLRRFVFATGDLVREETVSFLQRLPNRILTKPLEVETVRRVLVQALEPRRAEAS